MTGNRGRRGIGGRLGVALGLLLGTAALGQAPPAPPDAPDTPKSATPKSAPSRPAAARSPRANPAPREAAKPAGASRKPSGTAASSSRSSRKAAARDRFLAQPPRVFAAPKTRSVPFGSGPYGDETVDWSTVPAWQQAAFFGVRARGQTFIYVVDCSGSMLDEARLVRAKQELRRSIAALQFPQRFHVIFYNERPWLMPGGLPASADVHARDQLTRWLRLIEPDGGTDPRGAMGLAFGFHPDAIFLLSDGAFPDGADAAIGAANTRKIPIHCIDLAAGAAGDQLKRIANESGGKYVARP